MRNSKIQRGNTDEQRGGEKRDVLGIGGERGAGRGEGGGGGGGWRGGRKCKGSGRNLLR
jgi:hypothetical protein